MYCYYKDSSGRTHDIVSDVNQLKSFISSDLLQHQQHGVQTQQPVAPTQGGGYGTQPGYGTQGGGYRAPAQPFVGASPQSGFGAPAQSGYGTQPGYGTQGGEYRAPAQPFVGASPQTEFGAPAQPAYREPPQPFRGAPAQSGFGAPAQSGYGTQPGYGTQGGEYRAPYQQYAPPQVSAPPLEEKIFTIEQAIDFFTEVKDIAYSKTDQGFNLVQSFVGKLLTIIEFATDNEFCVNSGSILSFLCSIDTLTRNQKTEVLKSCAEKLLEDQKMIDCLQKKLTDNDHRDFLGALINNKSLDKIITPQDAHTAAPSHPVVQTAEDDHLVQAEQYKQPERPSTCVTGKMFYIGAAVLVGFAAYITSYFMSF